MRAVLAAAAIALSGCATVFTGKPNDPTPEGQQLVTVATDPAGAACETEGQSVTTPGTFKLSRRDGHTIACRLAGYEPTTAFVGSRNNSWLYLNLLFPPGFLVDFINGDAYTLTPEELRLALHKK